MQADRQHTLPVWELFKLFFFCLLVFLEDDGTGRENGRGEPINFSPRD